MSLKGVDSLDEIPWIFRVGFILLLVSCLFHVIGLGSAHWALTATDEYGTVEFAGLWEKCADLNLGGDEADFQCQGFVWEDVQVSHWFRTIQTMQSMSFIGMLVVALLAAMYMFVPDLRGYATLRYICVLLLFVAGLFIVTTCIVFGALKDVQKARTMPKSYVKLSWSFVLALLAGILDFVVAIIFIIGGERND
ncbi:LOW QUALITY PROTEIN: uncharacterized protein LOC117322432 [Pecten maximus]|uniref:LOW QUALITY PROTEIN: uncharacterized protein LOC117322432 n=1 Tax=Pecten maximus TaxID=6579 RepID=UPI001457EA0E|nr:LOW QUALITY PROTEIN: uncharacterized protein LOC117322432 [Pecten maximus]